jgi:DNA-binding NarL/FixJ family response regulator
MSNLLSKRESEVSLLIAAGYSDVQIARKLSIATCTAQGYVNKILEKTKTPNRTSAIVSLLIDGHINTSSVDLLRKNPEF